MLWKQILAIKSNNQFRRLTGVKRSTVEKMRFIVKAVKGQRREHLNGGKVSKLITEDQLWMMLMYNRECRTFLHIAADYGISEAQCWRIITDLETIEIQSRAFRLPGKKALTTATVKSRDIIRKLLAKNFCIDT